jgi:hypothetical protein
MKKTSHQSAARIVLAIIFASLVMSVLVIAQTPSAKDAESGAKPPAKSPAKPEKKPATKPAPKLAPKAGDISKKSKSAAGAQKQGTVKVAMVVYAKGKTGECFADGFLTTLARKSRTKISRRFTYVEMASQDIFEYPFLVMTGQGPFDLNDKERVNLKKYLNRGGLLLASSGCSNSAWAQSFSKQLAKLSLKGKLKPLAMDHAVFHTVYDIERIVAKSPTGKPIQLHGLEIAKRLVVIYSPIGLNDTSNAGDGCCCCGGNEIRDAHLINANIVAYALTH